MKESSNCREGRAEGWGMGKRLALSSSRWPEAGAWTSERAALAIVEIDNRNDAGG